ncbi:MAG TPA: DUF3368 domain-containing protein [Verrucomicrobiales bacterium]|nr:DUF3368 domain-containing protein [Verrucomicrobiales bacterium]
MPEVFCNTSPIQYLHQLDLLFLRPALYAKVGVPLAVIRELQAGIQKGVALPALPLPESFEEMDDLETDFLPFAALGPGENQVLAQLHANPGSLGILDDRPARALARKLGFRITGTLGVLLRAKQRALIPTLRPCLHRLEEAGFRIHPVTRQEVLRLANEA